MKVELTKIEIETLRHALYMLRDQQRTHLRLCRGDEDSKKAQRDAARFNRLISDSLVLDTKLSDAE